MKQAKTSNERVEKVNEEWFKSTQNKTQHKQPINHSDIHYKTMDEKRKQKKQPTTTCTKDAKQSAENI